MGADDLIGKVYRWRGRGELWRVLARWGSPDRAGPLTAVCDDCGSILYWPVASEIECVPFCHCTGDPFELLPGRRQFVQGPRNVLIENVDTGLLVIRPFRGLRKP